MDIYPCCLLPEAENDADEFSFDTSNDDGDDVNDNIEGDGVTSEEDYEVGKYIYVWANRNSDSIEDSIVGRVLSDWVIRKSPVESNFVIVG